MSLGSGYRAAAIGLGTAAALFAGAAQAEPPHASIQKAAISTFAKIDTKTCGGIAAVGQYVFSRLPNVKHSPVFLNSLADWIDSNCATPYKIKWVDKEDRATFNTFAGQLLAGKPKDRVYLDRLGVELAPQPTIPIAPQPTASTNERAPG